VPAGTVILLIENIDSAFSKARAEGGRVFLGVRKYVLESAAFVWAMQQAVQAVDRKSLKGAIRYDA
jgi:hypothetical protein